MTRPAGSAAPERTALAWQRTALDFAVIAVLLVRDVQGLRSPARVLPAALALAVGVTVLVVGRRRPYGLGRPALRALGTIAAGVGMLAGVVLLLP